MSGTMSEVSEKHSQKDVVTMMGPLLFDFQMDLPHQGYTWLSFWKTGTNSYSRETSKATMQDESGRLEVAGSMSAWAT